MSDEVAKKMRVCELAPFYRKWYDEVKEGRRTFRFIGDPQEYDLNGPAIRKKGGTTPRPDKPRLDLTAEETAPAPVAEPHSPIPAPEGVDSSDGKLPYLVALGMLLAGLGCWFFRRMKIGNTDRT